MAFVMSLSIYIIGLTLGSSIVLSGNYWVSSWIGIEISTFAILPLMTRQHDPRAVDAATKYFIIQALSSTALLFAAMSNLFFPGASHVDYPLHPAPAFFMTLGLALKLGLVPFQFWFSKIIQGLDSTTGFLISTWQKMVPLLFLVKLQMNLPWPILLVMGLLTVLVGSWVALDLDNPRKSLAYFSLIIVGWMVTAHQIVPGITLIVFAVYCMTTTCVFMIFMLKQTSTLSSPVVSWPNLFALAGVPPLTMFYLVGVHPFTTFLPKWVFLTQLSEVGVVIASVAISAMALYSLLMFLFTLHLNQPSAEKDDSSPFGSWSSPDSIAFALVVVISCLAAGCLFFLPAAPLDAYLKNIPFRVR